MRRARGRAAPDGAVRAAAMGLALAVALGATACAQEAPDPEPGDADAADAAGGAVGDAPVVLVTGSTGGLGREVARAFAERGAHVIVHGRSVERGEALVAEIEADGSGSARFYAADFSDFANVRDLADRLKGDYDRLDILVNNAGIYLPDEERFVDDDGVELHFKINHLAHFLLTHELLPLLQAAAPSHIVNVASAGQAPLDFADPYMEEGYTNRRAYSQSKLAQITFTMELAERLEGTGIRVNTLHPATTMDTDMARELGRENRNPIEPGRDAVMFVATDFEGSGQYFDMQEPTRAHDQAYDPDAQDRLWELSETLTGIEWDGSGLEGSAGEG